MNKILQYIASTTWLINKVSLENLINIVMRNNDIEAFRAEYKKIKASSDDSGILGESNGITITNDGTAVIKLQGPIIPYANMFEESCGSVSIDTLSKNLAIATKNKDVKNILLDVDSPGGNVVNISEFAKRIKDNSKPVSAYVRGMGASAAYWIISACDRIYSAPTAFVGSIGVIYSCVSTKERDKKEGIEYINIVSSASPYKISDPTTKEGKEIIKDEIDDLANVFINTVAENRNVDTKFVKSNFGKGGIYIAEKAKKNKMIDEVCTYQECLNKINSKKEAPNMAEIEMTKKEFDSKLEASIKDATEQLTVTHEKEIKALKIAAQAKEQDQKTQAVIDYANAKINTDFKAKGHTSVDGKNDSEDLKRFRVMFTDKVQATSLSGLDYKAFIDNFGVKDLKTKVETGNTFSATEAPKTTESKSKSVIDSIAAKIKTGNPTSVDSWK